MFTELTITMADWHHHHFAGGQGAKLNGDEELLAIFVFSALLIVFGTLIVSLVSSPIVLFFTRKAHSLFWAVPAVNLLIYLVMLLLRPYPEGFVAQFRLPGLVFTVIEVLLLLMLSLILAAILALLYTIVRRLRSPAKSKQEPLDREQDLKNPRQNGDWA